MAVLVPALSGWLKDPKTQLDTMFAYALTSDYSQSTIYDGNITSIAYLVRKYQSNPSQMAHELQSALYSMYIDVYDSVSVEVTYSSVAANGKYTLNISVAATKAGNTYSLAVTSSVDNGALTSVLNILNN